jgi:hypothetical protein
MGASEASIRRRRRRRRTPGAETFDVKKFKALWSDPRKLKEVLREVDSD